MNVASSVTGTLKGLVPSSALTEKYFLKSSILLKRFFRIYTFVVAEGSISFILLTGLPKVKHF